MELVKEVSGHKIMKKRSGRFAVKSSKGQWVNGEEKVKILVDAGLVKAVVAKKVEPAPEAEEAANTEVAE